MISGTRMSGAGNTFIVVDGRMLGSAEDLSDLAVWICSEDRGHGGVDGFIVVQPSPEHDFLMRYFNRDGSSGMMCGNGGRCAVVFAGDLGLVKNPEDVRFINAGVEYRARVTPRGVKVWFPDPRAIDLDGTTQLGDRVQTCHRADVGTPHVVVFLDESGPVATDALEALDIERWGPPLRSRSEVQPEGANANFVEIVDGGIRLRTWERGVEGETRACGTGAISSAIVAALHRGLRPPIAVQVASGDTLWIDFRRHGPSVTDVSMEGPVREVPDLF